MIDYYVVSEGLLPCVLECDAIMGPFRPHRIVYLEMAARPRNVFVRTLVRRPTPLPTLTELQKAPEVEWPPYYNKAQEGTKLNHARIYPRQLLKILGPDVQKASRISEKLCQWSSAAESITLDRSDIDPTAHRP